MKCPDCNDTGTRWVRCGANDWDPEECTNPIHDEGPPDIVAEPSQYRPNGWPMLPPKRRP